MSDWVLASFGFSWAALSIDTETTNEFPYDPCGILRNTCSLQCRPSYSKDVAIQLVDKYNAIGERLAKQGRLTQVTWVNGEYVEVY